MLPVLLLAACAGAPQQRARSGGSSVVANGAYHTPPPGFPHFVDHSIGREEISIQAMGLVGIPYRWGGNTPDSGFDCSGLVRYVVARAASVNLPRTTAQMSERGESIEPDEIAPGDLIFFNTTGRAHSHVGIYVGKLRFVNAPSTGGTVRLDYLTNPYWAKRFDGIRRMAAPVAAPFDAPSYQAAAPQVPERAGTATQAPAYAGAATSTSRVAPASGGAPSTAIGEAPPSDYAAASRQPQALVAATPRASIASPENEPQRTSATMALAPGRSPTPQADPFEPPPPAISAAQIQARAAGATAPATSFATAPAAAPATVPTTSPDAYATRGDPRTEPPAQRSGGASQAAYANAPDPIDAAADAFEPPPPAYVAARQAQRAQQANPTHDSGAQLMRASTASRALPAPSQTNDDPIARFANGNF